MVRFDPAGRRVAARPPAASVPGVECLADPVWYQSVGSDFEGYTGGGIEDRAPDFNVVLVIHTVNTSLKGSPMIVGVSALKVGFAVLDERSKPLSYTGFGHVAYTERSFVVGSRCFTESALGEGQERG
jgi:hypothetical protein